MLPCDVCVAHGGSQEVPYRDPDDARTHHLCPLCLDAMLAYFPLHPRRFLQRELTGDFFQRWRCARARSRSRMVTTVTTGAASVISGSSAGTRRRRIPNVA